MISRTSVLKIVEDNPALSGFELFWRSYPKKKSKGDAAKAWHQTAKVRPPIEAILAAIQTANESADWHKDGGQFIPYPATWLRDWGWADE